MLVMPRMMVFATILAVAGCADDEHKGTISHGPPDAGGSAPQGAAVEAQTRLIYGPGSPLATFRSATAMRNRLQKLGIPKQQISIGGEQIHVEVPNSKVEAVKRALAVGRLELYSQDEAADPFEAKKQQDAASAAGFEVKTESFAAESGKVSLHYLEGPLSKQGALLPLLKSQQTTALALYGAVYRDRARAGLVRSYYAHVDRTVRGEHVLTARAVEAKDGAQLVLHFGGAGKSFIRWESKRRARFIVKLDGWVEGTVEPTEQVTDGVLVLHFGGSIEDAQKLARSLDQETAMSHLVTLVKEQPLR